MLGDITFYKGGEHLLEVVSRRDLALKILGLVLRHRRLPSGQEACAQNACSACTEPQIGRVLTAIERNHAVTFILPAFPGKSPNPAKVLGTRPDMAERQSLAFINALCQDIQKIYAPGARIILCSDGRVFNDVVRIADNDITLYQQDLNELIAELGTQNLATFNLDNVFRSCRFDEMRSRLMEGYGERIETVQEEVRVNDDARRLYCGITRFLLEDALRPNMAVSRTALQKECRRRAYAVIQRSQAWDGLLAQHFPEAVRLSIHPQACGSRKIGIHLMETRDEWLTAWHSVAVEVQGRYRLMKRQHAESLGAQLVSRDGRPSHFVLSEEAQ